MARAFADHEDDIEDILQEAWLIAIRRYGSKEDSPEGAWLHTIVLNVGRNWARKRKRRRDLFEEFGTPLPVSERKTIGDELADLALWRAVASLPGLQQRVLLLRIVDGLSTAETAEALGRAEGTVKASLFRATRNLRKEIGEYES